MSLLLALQGVVSNEQTFVIKTGTGGIDPVKRKSIYKPTGLLNKKKSIIDERIVEAKTVSVKIAETLTKELAGHDVKKTTLSEIEREINHVLNIQKIQEEEEIILIMSALH